MVFDDQIFGLCIMASGCLEFRREVNTSENVDPDTWVLFHLLNRGIWDQEIMDSLQDPATRAVRFSAVMGEQLWRMIDGHTAQVGRDPDNQTPADSCL